MNGLSQRDFPTFFNDIYGYDPFPWQRRLTEQVLASGAWPEVVDLPTGSGKTAVLDTAIFAMAASPDISPRRVVFVIDRRIVVDQVYKRAELIQRRIESGATPTLRAVQENLHSISDGKSLGVAALRGGIPIDNEWTHNPEQPWIMVSTVDQFGSRLLFRGYGVSSIMRPVHAGLAGNDCLVVLDEVHISVPFAETLAQVANLDSPILPRRFTVVEMSATPSNQNAERFTLDSDDIDCHELRRRVDAPKEATLVSVRNGDAVPTEVTKIVKSLRTSGVRGNSSKSLPLSSNPAGQSVGVVVNRVRTARDTHQALEDAGITALLVTGRMRPLDRIEIMDRVTPIVDPDSEQRPEELVAVVATQAIEVGADFSFDAMITECAAVDSLRQRFGRLDRRGTKFDRTGNAASAWIIGPRSAVSSKNPDPIYGEAVKATWQELEKRNEKGPIDIGTRSLQGFSKDAIAPRHQAPLLLTTHMDAWIQTKPEPIMQPTIDWFLHGIDQRQTQDVSLVWRFDRTTDALRLVPPRQAEFLQVPINAAKAWLSGSAEVEVADISQETAGNRINAAQAGDNNGCIRRWGFEDGVEDVGINQIRPGDIILVDPSRGGIRSGTWDPSSNEPVEDLGDAAQIEYGRRATLRLDSRLLSDTPPAVPGDEDDADSRSAIDRISEWLQQKLEASEDQNGWFFDTITRLKSGFEINVVGLDGKSENGTYYVLSEKHPDTGRRVVDADTMDGSDEAVSLIGTGVPLSRHLDGVGERAGRIAKCLGLSEEIVEDLRLAGRLHDLGKVDIRFQEQLVGGDRVELEMLEEPLAKSLPAARRTRRYPAGMRHEVASVAMAESNPYVLSSAHDKDLVLHLIGTHHGYSRPLPPIIEDEESPTLSYIFDGIAIETRLDLPESSMALDMADRFWRLIERYGYYGLTWLETILRLADHRQSAEGG